MAQKNRMRFTGITIGLCLVVFIAATIFAVRQPPRKDPFKPPGSLYKKIRFPYEENAFLRLPMVTGTFNDVFVTKSSGHVWAVGNDGLLIVSRDKGRSWQQQILPDRQKPVPQVPAPEAPSGFRVLSQSVFQWGPASAWAASKEKSSRQIYRPQEQKVRPVQKTAPDAKKKVPSAVKGNVPPPHLTSIFFADDTTGWISGSNGTVLSTIDGGQTWAYQDTDTDVNLLGVYFTDKDFGWACGENAILLSTENGGKTWQKKQISGAPFSWWSAIFFLDRNNGWICGLGGKILYTTDAGRTWRHHEIEMNEDLFLFSVYFLNAKTGWAAGQAGRLFSTRDGGRTWNRVRSGIPDSDLYHISFSDPEHGWISGSNGTVLVTADGGQTWKSRNLDTQSSLKAICFVDKQTGWACGEEGTLLSTSDGGGNWESRTGGLASNLTDIFFADKNFGWASGSYGTFFFTRDGGRTWNPTDIGTSSRVSSVYFTDRTHGWACVKNEYKIRLTTDGGQHWQDSKPVPPLLSDVAFADKGNGWICGKFGVIQASTDGGLSWERRWDTASAGEMTSLCFIDKDTGWVLEKRRMVNFTSNGGKKWSRYNTRAKVELNAIHFTDLNHGWICGQKGSIFYTDDGGKTWTPQDSGTRVSLTALTFTNKDEGWICGEKGTLLFSKDSGRRWTVRNTGTSARLSSVHFQDSSHGWIAGGRGTIRFTRDGGQNWEGPVYKRLPAPWYWGLCLLLILICLFVVQKGNAPQSSGETVADLLASDRPIEAGDPDPLGFEKISSGLSRFIANIHTNPPLTIAVTGEWGTGKSSLMNLLYHDLKQRRFQPVWFNAWHHQKGEQLLASLYAQIRRQALPSVWHPAGFQFRLRLFFRRVQRNRLIFGVLALLFFAAFPVLQDGLKAFFSASYLFITYLAWGQTDKAAQILSFSSLAVAIQDKWLSALLASPAVAGSLKAIRAFGLSPQNLLVMGSGSSTKKAGMDPAARSRFTEEFRDVASSLDLGAMVIFIDDLDRCSKENVVEILETINFLAVSGNCFIILGMARQWVETCVALQFKELAEETGNDKRAHFEDGFSHRQRFARQYLEKLINIEVPVPVPSSDASKALLNPESPDPASPMEQILLNTKKRFKKYLPVLCLICLAVLGWYVQDFFRMPSRQSLPQEKKELLILPQSAETGELQLKNGLVKIPLNKNLQTDQKNDSRPLEIVIMGKADALEKGIPIGTLGTKEGEADMVLRYKRVPDPEIPSPSLPRDDKKEPSFGEGMPAGISAFETGQADDSYTGHLLALLVGVGLAVIGLVYLVQRPQRFTRDSRTFREALAIWHPWIVLVRRTPRSIKRFLNRLRYVAMRCRFEPPSSGLWQRLKINLLNKNRPDISKEQETIPESVLVALGAIYHVKPEWVKDPKALHEIFSSTDLTGKLFQQSPDNVEQPEHFSRSDTALAAAVQEFKTTFNIDVEELLRYRTDFLTVLAETGI